MSERYSQVFSGTPVEVVDTLECLVRIDRGEPLDARATGLLERLVQAGMVDRRGPDLMLTPAGIALCQSIKHRLASDREAVRVLAERRLLLASELDALGVSPFG